MIFDPERDLAVLRVPGLTAPALRLQENARVGDVGVILGYPRNGGLREIPARIQQVSIAKGPDIYGRHMASRQVFALYGGITRGMSGGPLVTTAGTVSAMVFATDLGSAQGSFALTARELSSQARAGTTAVTAVSTGPCSD
ncbi:trypsin-like peptidase domain-containing protein [Actinoallomurus iriomotensis]|uniref:Serine protease n=1 Tax=Actinoallomurus iriomotensis TaxID=478107 RepID=A0A9W6SDC0_9ACTN|nr:trypsin-like peptidase domain-containing protein [Actinoallomurus iriomotensis]GLY91514.1 hypothetical protein Airi02_094420 [Actinoallomurus iriomotensis]